MIPGMPQLGNGKAGLVLGKVVEIHPEQNTIDVAVMSDFRRLVGVPVLSSMITGQTGTVDLHVPDLTTNRKEDEQFGEVTRRDPKTGQTASAMESLNADTCKWASFNTDRRDIIAVIASVEGAPVCLGFLAPPVCELNFPPEIGEEFRIQRHASDLYETIDKDANHEWYHPSGTFLRVAEDPEHLDLTGKDWDKKWAIRRNTQRAPHVHLVVASAGSKVADVHIDPEGNVSLTADGDVRIKSQRVTVEALDATIMAPSIDLVGEVKINGVPRGMSGTVF